ncbi:hypothetical protein EJ08DRAFT_689156 [Tothia fuscella]|uniref:DNA helicase n=1 Tax=Tothia fuscella TaxID=1048955 RepID=A0A9P4NLH9_9PEZI|nr:hypothetical protein EJ08DRAFT_689156 [Tothia fuscella]
MIQQADTIATLPYNNRSNQFHPQTATLLHTPTHITQPTQPMQPAQNTQPTQAWNATPPRISQILVPASSSPAKQSSPQIPKPISRIAPPGTTFRAPIMARNNFFTNTPQTENTQSSDPPAISISDSEDELTNADIPATSFSSFRAKTSQFSYNPSMVTVPQKRGVDGMISSYANVSRPPRPQPQIPRQIGPVANVMRLDDIEDWELREKVIILQRTLHDYTVEQFYRALQRKKGDIDDATDYLLSLEEPQAAPKPGVAAIDLTNSDDEPGGVAQVKRGPELKRASNPRRPLVAKSMMQRYSKIEAKAPPPRPVSSPVAERAAPPPPKRRRLVQGRKAEAAHTRTLTPEPVIEIDSDDSDVVEEVVDVLGLLNTYTEQEIVDLVGFCTLSDAALVVSKRPFKRLDQVRKVAHPDAVTATGKRRGGNKSTIGERIVNKAVETETGLQAVDRVVQQCNVYSRDIKKAMKDWGIDMSKAEENGLNIVSLSSTDKHDSGTGTPTSSEKGTGSKDFLGQPALMSPEITLKDYQVVGLNWLNLVWSKRKAWSTQRDASIGCILADDMGLGKTCQVIAFLTHLQEQDVKGPHLIIVPASTIENWLREFRRFSPSIAVEPYYGLQAERIEIRDTIMRSLEHINVIITTYDTAVKDHDAHFLRKLRPTTCIFDEGHALKNASSNRYKVLSRIKTGFRLLLTGTPLQNNLQELMSVLAFIVPDLFNKCQEDFELIFSHRAKTTDTDHAALLSARRIARAKSMLSPFILRRSKAQVMKDLPKKTRRVEYCDMTERQQSFYTEYATMHAEAMAARKASAKTDGYMHLVYRRQAAIHPLLLPRDLYSDATIEKMWPKIPRKGKFKKYVSDEGLREYLQWMSDFELHSLCLEVPQLNKFALKNNEWMDSGKINKLIELLEKFNAEGSRTLVFSQFVKVLDILEAVFDNKGITRCRIDGATPVNNRQTLIDQFYEDESINVFMLSTRSGGAGINLACANKVIILDSGFNPQDDIQAENRAHRIGQTRDVEVIKLITKGTVEEQIHKLGESKVMLDGRVTGGNDDDTKTEKEIEKKGMEELEKLLLEQAGKGNGEEVKAEVENGEGIKVEEEKGTGDLKDAFMDGLKARGVTVSK